ncbi:MAG: hypothetical protein KAI53_00925 [Candidatus Aenigmarchaeota archaeon]|nr:hypothetical protein [Candidatus Aenigmarchaeota archaeon]
MFEILAVILGILWMYDLYQTLRLTKRFGIRIEENPFARFLLKHKRIDFVIFKLIDLLFVIAIMYFVNVQNIVLARGLLSVFVLIYVFTVVHNQRVYKGMYKLY